MHECMSTRVHEHMSEGGRNGGREAVRKGVSEEQDAERFNRAKADEVLIRAFFNTFAQRGFAIILEKTVL